MDYEKKYKDALERARNLHKDAIDMGESLRAKQCEIIFPELGESEDERIRKNLIELFHDTVSNDEIFSDYGLDKTEVLAWLEKQNSNVDNANKEYWRGYREGKQGILDKYAELEKQVEQKPTDEEMKEALQTEYEKGRADAIAEMTKTWSEEDEKILRTIISDGIRGAEFDMLQINWLKSIKQRIGG